MDEIKQHYWNKYVIGLNRSNKDFDFPVFHITEDMNITYEGVSRIVMLDRYSYKDLHKSSLSVGDLVVLTVKHDPKYPTRGTGEIAHIDWKQEKVTIIVDEEFRETLEDPLEKKSGVVQRSFPEFDKPLELFYEQIAKRNAVGIAEVENTVEEKEEAAYKYYNVLANKELVPAGRVLHGAGADTEVTYFNCYVMPFIQDSRGGISRHREEVMEIMSRGGGVGTNGSTIRPRGAVAKTVNGRASGSVSWMDDIAKLTHLVEQGGSRRGAQMIMLADWHPDILEFIISKMQNPRMLRYIMENTEDEEIKELCKNKIKFTPLNETEKDVLEDYVGIYDRLGATDSKKYSFAKRKLSDGGTYDVHNPEFLSGANISVCITEDFMKAVENDDYYDLKFPDTENYSEEEMKDYNEKWHEIGDVREWERLGYAVKTYRSIRAKDLWDLINTCSTYSAEPGIFFIDNANEATNARAYGQKVVATNPCGEQPLAPYSVCNLAAVNLAQVADKDNKEVDFDKLKRIVDDSVRFQDGVISATPYFLEANKKQALGERRVGLGVMGLHDLLIYTETKYGSEEGNQLVDKVFETIATQAYRTSIDLAKEKGSFPFLDNEDGTPSTAKRKAFINTGFMKKMPEDIRQDILTYGIRNSHLVTVAPTGSTGTMMGVSTGLEPYYSFSYFRSGRLGKFIEVKADIVQEYLNNNPEADENNLPEWFVSSMEMTPEAHADTQCVIQRWVDSSLSKTCNAPKGFTVDQVKGLYERLYKGGAKGGTVYVDGSRDSQVLTLKAEENDLDSEEDTVYKGSSVVIMHKDKVISQAVGEKSVSTMVQTEGVVKASVTDIGVEVGQTCPVCNIGTVEDIGGCNTCTNCKAQLKCGL